MYDIVGRRKWFFVISGLLISLGFGAMIYSLVQFGTPMQIGVDFTGGSRFEIQFTEPASESAIRQVFADYRHHAESVVQRDKVPDGYRFYVRRYFQLIRPR